YQEVARFEPARPCLERLIGGREDDHYRSVDTGLGTYRGWHELALLFPRMGDPLHCAPVLRRLAADHPPPLPARLDLAQTALQLGKRDEAAAVLERIPAVEGTIEGLQRLHALLAGSARATAAPPQSAKADLVAPAPGFNPGTPDPRH